MFKKNPEVEKIKERIKAQEEKIKDARRAVDYHNRMREDYLADIEDREVIVKALQDKLCELTSSKTFIEKFTGVTFSTRKADVKGD
jgi:hypothetical protein